MVLGTLSAASIEQGDVRSAREHLTNGLLLARAHKDHKFVPEFLELAAALAEVSAQPERSLQLLASAEQFYAAVGLTPFDSWHETFKKACSVLAPDTVEVALTTGRNMTMSGAIAIALEDPSSPIASNTDIGAHMGALSTAAQKSLPTSRTKDLIGG
jgi:hypothetical protein